MAEPVILNPATMPSLIKSFGTRLGANREAQFWLLQFVGWLGISLISYVSLNLWYNQPQLTYVLHNVLQSLLGIALSWPLRLVFRSYWSASWAVRACVIVVSVMIFALAWAVIRLATFEAMTDETNLWADFGGWYFSSIFIFLSWAAFYHGIKYYRLLLSERDQLLAAETLQKEEVLRRTRAEAAVKESQLTLLRYQLNPHFLFNTLNSIYALIDKGAADQASSMLLNLSHFLRYSLDHGADRSVELSKEVDAANLYLAIEQTRFVDRLAVEFDISKDSSRALVPSFLLQPLIENAIKHAIAQNEQGGTIKITAYTDDMMLRVHVEDSGSGRESAGPAGQVSGAGVGLKNVRERIATLYGNRGRLETQRSELGGFCVALAFPLETGLGGQ